MAEFEFSLQTALDLRCREEQQAQQRVASAQRQVNRCRADLERTRDRIDTLLGSLRDSRQGGRVSVALGRVEHEHRVLAEFRRRLARQRGHLAEAERTLEQRRAELLEASQARRTLERLSERREAEHRREQVLSEQRELNEAAVSRHHMNDRSPGLLVTPGTER